jgi:hypothetical protein
VIIEVQPKQFLRWRSPESEPSDATPASEFEEAFHAEGSVTRVTIRERAFGAPPQEDTSVTELGWNESIADLVLFLESGVRFPRHMAPRSWLGASTRNTAAGVEILRVESASFAGRLGLRPGDLLLQLGGAPIFDRSDVALVLRVVRPRTRLEAVIARDGALLRADAVL